MIRYRNHTPSVAYLDDHVVDFVVRDDECSCPDVVWLNRMVLLYALVGWVMSLVELDRMGTVGWVDNGPRYHRHYCYYCCP